MARQDEQWALIGPLILAPRRRDDGRGRLRRAAREMMKGVLRVLRSGAKCAGNLRLGERSATS
jgi:hypothetical protein